MVISKQENGILINYMALLGVNMKMAVVIGGRKRIIKMKDMEQESGLMDRNTRGNGCRIRVTVME
jgi:hypothetical protein